MPIAEHSRCQPGRPRPNGLSQAGSPARWAFQSTKSRAILLLVLVAVDPRAAPDLAVLQVGQPAVAGKGGDAEVQRALAAVGQPVLAQLAVPGRSSRGHARWRGDSAPPARCRDESRSSKNASMYGWVACSSVSPRSDHAADDLVLDVGDVHDLGHREARGASTTGAAGPPRRRRGSSRCARSRRRSGRRCTCRILPRLERGQRLGLDESACCESAWDVTLMAGGRSTQILARFSQRVTSRARGSRCRTASAGRAVRPRKESRPPRGAASGSRS